MKAKQKTLGLNSTYRLKVTLKGIKPPIWRRIEVSNQITLSKLHQILQVAMGWTDSHLHHFLIGETYYAEPDPEFGSDNVNENRVKLSQLPLREKMKFYYDYDFGDNWEHEILVEKIITVTGGNKPPVCLKGRRACPPEDIGGIWGYAEFLEAIGDPKHPDHEGILEWVGGQFDPETFELEEINRKLAKLR
ncbi:MAG: plasmid pRiA4b ORF-3 family protein [Syntrophales bacterium]|nr:plasmid pRiA4b ORF-3 family protein [Syntrophales bacterium]